MNLHENTVFGRKVFFLDPPFSVSKLVLPKLSELEYEVYTISSYKRAKSILKLFPDSICFINIEDELDVDSWFNFIQSFENDAKLSTIFVGVIASRVSKNVRDRYMLHATIPAGFIQYGPAMDNLIETLQGILDINGAKGRRKYVRADCTSDRLISAKCSLSGVTYSFQVQNISSVGVSCFISPTVASVFPVNTVLRDFTLIIRNRSLHCGSAVIMTKTENNRLLLVLLFLKGISSSEKTYIREYIQSTLQTNVDMLVFNETPDMTDYSTSQIKQVINTSNEDLETLEEVEELEEATLAEEKIAEEHINNNFVEGQTVFSKKDLGTTDLF